MYGSTISKKEWIDEFFSPSQRENRFFGKVIFSTEEGGVLFLLYLIYLLTLNVIWHSRKVVAQPTEYLQILNIATVN